jgi:serine/threonine protein kinase/WD40 repeat protein
MSSVTDAGGVVPEPIDADALFLELVELPPEQRDAELVRRCGDDESLRDEVLALLAADAAAQGFLEPVALGLGVTPRAWLEGRTVGHYTLGRVIGHGGMGTVYEATQRAPRRTVALKILRAGVGAHALRRRFAQEAEILGRLRHPGIAEIHEAATYDSELGPLPYFALAFIPGAQPITAWARAVPRRDRIAAMVEVCRAVHHAHGHGVVHRDLKPSNILVGDDGRPRLIDFGVAALIDEAGRAATLGTRLGELVGTLHYMSPEQCDASGAEPDARTDVYALGVVLYELVAERLPYPIERVPAAMVAELIRTHEPAAPTQICGPKWRELDAVILTALEKSPARRQASAAALADELERALRGEPVHAMRSRRAHRARRLLWRARRVVPASLALGAAGIAAAAWVSSSGAQDLGASAHASYLHRIAVAERAIAGHDLARAKLALAECPEAERGWEWDRLHATSDGSAQILEVGAPVQAIAIDVDGATPRLIAVTHDGRVDAWTREPDAGWTHGWTTTLDDEPGALAIDSTQDRIYVGGDRRHVHVLDGRGARLGTIAAGRSTIWGLAVTDAGLVVTRQDGTLETWDAATDRRALSVSTGARLGAARAHGEGVLTTTLQGVSLRDPTSGASLREFVDPQGPEVTLALGDALYTAGWKRRIVEFDLATGARRREFPERGDGIADLVAIDGDTLASAGRDGEIVLWNRQDASVRRILRGHDFAVVTLALDVSDAGSWLVSGSADGTVRTWDLGAPAIDQGWRAQEKIHALAWTDPTRIVSAGGPQWGRDDTDEVIAWSTDDGRVLARADDHRATVDAIAATATTVASGSRDGEVVLRDRGLSPQVRIAAHAGAVAWLGFDAAGTRVASQGSDGTIAIWSAGDGASLRHTDAGVGALHDGAWTGDGLLAVGDGGLVRWTIDDAPIVDRTATDLVAVAAIPDGRLVLGDAGGTLMLRGPDGDERWRVPTFGRAIADLAVSPTGDRVAVASQDYRVRLYDADTGELVLTVGSHDTAATTVAFAPDGGAIASGGFDRFVRVWSATRGR